MTRMEARPLRLVLLFVIALLAGGCAADGSAPSPAASATSPTVSASSDRIDVGGREIHLQCWGEPADDRPTVLLIAGQGPTSSSWQVVAGPLADEGVHLCAYDRAGIGGSDPAPPGIRTTQDQVDELIALLDAAELTEPLIVVAHSLGALPAVGLAAAADDRVAGVVLVEPWSPRVSTAMRAVLPPEQPGESPELAEERWALTVMPFDPGLNPEGLLVSAADEEVAALLDQPGPIFGDAPVVVLRAPPPPPLPGLPEGYHEASVAAYDAGFREFAAESTRGTLILVEEAGHDLHRDQPEAVMSAIRELLAG
jgi:pimeloyl-ACP methyl ester carboxylesterase